MINSMNKEKVSVKGLYKSYGSLSVLENIDFVAHEGEFVTLIGPSGCGKSTLFSILAGLELADRGELNYNGQPFTPKPGQMAYMLQRDGLLPWRTVLDNAILGLELAGVNKKVARERAYALFEDFGLKGFEKSYPWQLSGGMRQRLALLRTVLTEREVLMLDEPFGALDALTRSSLQEWLVELQNQLHRTILFITHDIDEALLLSDRVYVLSHRPARVLSVYEVNLPRPRTVTDLQLVGLKGELLQILRPEARNEAI